MELEQIYPCGLNEGFSLRFRVSSRLQHETPEEGQRTHCLKCCEYNNEDNSPNTLNDKNIGLYLIAPKKNSNFDLKISKINF